MSVLFRSGSPNFSRMDGPVCRGFFVLLRSSLIGERGLPVDVSVFLLGYVDLQQLVGGVASLKGNRRGLLRSWPGRVQSPAWRHLWLNWKPDWGLSGSERRTSRLRGLLSRPSSDRLSLRDPVPRVSLCLNLSLLSYSSPSSSGSFGLKEMFFRRETLVGGSADTDSTLCRVKYYIGLLNVWSSSYGRLLSQSVLKQDQKHIYTQIICTVRFFQNKKKKLQRRQIKQKLVNTALRKNSCSSDREK